MENESLQIKRSGVQTQNLVKLSITVLDTAFLMEAPQTPPTRWRMLT